MTDVKPSSVALHVLQTFSTGPQLYRPSMQQVGETLHLGDRDAEGREHDDVLGRDVAVSALIARMMPFREGSR